MKIKTKGIVLEQELYCMSYRLMKEIMVDEVWRLNEKRNAISVELLSAN